MNWNQSYSSPKFAYFQVEEQLFPTNKGKQGSRKTSDDNSQFFFRAFHLQIPKQDGLLGKQIAEHCDYLCRGKKKKIPMNRTNFKIEHHFLPFLSSLFPNSSGHGKSSNRCTSFILISLIPKQLWSPNLILKYI